MSDGSGPKPLSLTPVWLVILAVLGVYSGSSGSQKSHTGGANPPAQKSQAGEGADQPDDEVAVSRDTGGRPLGPLIDYLSNGSVADEPKGSGLTTGLERSMEILEAISTPGTPGRNYGFRAMIATIASPMHSTNSFRFDELLAPMQRAAEAEGFVLDRYHFPWGEPRSPKPSKDHQSTTNPADPMSARGVGEFGTLLFRRRPGATTSSDPPGDGPVSGDGPVNVDLLVVLLCTETPTAGVDRKSLEQALKAVEFLRDKFPAPPEAGARPTRGNIQILGPVFSGSQTSLEDVLARHTSPEGKEKPHFRVISGNTMGVDRGQFRRSVPNSDFSSTLHSAKSQTNAIITYLQKHSSFFDRATRRPIVLLVESNTGYGQSFKGFRTAGDGGEPEIVQYCFPMHVASIRGSYNRLGLMHDAASGTIRGAARLSVPEDESGGIRDVPPPMTPGTTAGNEEMSLIEALTDVARRDPLAVGIIATDPRDVVFLARLTREFCPEAKLFADQADLLYARPQSTSFLRGMLVATTYPLAMRNQWWTAPVTDNRTRQSFVNDSAYGMYNAMTAHLSDLGLTGDHPPRYIEYRAPFPTAGVGPSRPPIWICAVGQRGLTPIQMESQAESDPLADDDPLFKPESAAIPVQSPGSTIRADKLTPLYYNGWSIVVVATFLASIVLNWATNEAIKEDSLGSRRDLDRRPKSTARDAGSGRLLYPSLRWLAVGHVILLLFAWTNSSALLRTVYLFRRTYPGPEGRAILHAAWPWLAAYSLILPVLSLGYLLGVLGSRSLHIKLLHAPPQSAIPPWRSAPVLGVVAAVGLLSLGAWTLGPSATDTLSTWYLAFERTMLLPSGLTPVFPSLFLSASLLTWIFASSYRRYITSHLWESIDRGADDNPRPTGRGGSTDRISFGSIWSDADASQARVEALLRDPKAVVLNHRVASGFVALFYLLGICPVIFRNMAMNGIGQTLESPLYNAVFMIGLLIAYFLLTFGLLYLIGLWHDVKETLRIFAGLPLDQSFDRQPPRVARWIYDASPWSVKERKILEHRAIIALKSEEDDPDLRASLARFSAGGTDEAGEGGPLPSDSSKRLRHTLLELWEGIPIYASSQARREGSSSSRPDEEGSASDHWQDAPRLRDLSKDDRARVGAWARKAEDLAAIRIVQWTTPGLAQLWNLAGCLVTGGICLLLTVTSYPFVSQQKLLLVVGGLLLAIALAILYLLVGLNRDEIISRLSNTRPNRFSFDGMIASNVLTYIVPLLGLLAAISFDFGDILRNWLDPLFRLLD
ncbi:hypothetical protein [Aquisphaera insulae]|uniref:hypothetical protein n=1 Tax=Aquisphaera insulae TaxID=2712864 RepID=UPI0013EA5A4D|nr:hypothetical protein [Aquisphaera insulae]